MELRFDTMLHSGLGNESSDAGHIKCSRGLHLAHGPPVTTPASEGLSRSLAHSAGESWPGV